MALLRLPDDVILCIGDYTGSPVLATCSSLMWRLLGGCYVTVGDAVRCIQWERVRYLRCRVGSAGPPPWLLPLCCTASVRLLSVQVHGGGTVSTALGPLLPRFPRLRRLNLLFTGQRPVVVDRCCVAPPFPSPLRRISVVADTPTSLADLLAALVPSGTPLTSMGLSAPAAAFEPHRLLPLLRLPALVDVTIVAHGSHLADELACPVAGHRAGATNGPVPE